MFLIGMGTGVSSGVSLCGEASGLLSPPRERGEEDHSAGAAPEPLPGNLDVDIRTHFYSP